MWIIEPLEIKLLGAHTGKFRLTARSDEDGGGPFGLCNHEHDTPEEAAKCPEAKERSYVYGGIRPETIESAERAELARLKAKYEPQATDNSRDGHGGNPYLKDLMSFADLLAACNVIHEEAVTDPEGYDGGITMRHIAEAHRRLVEANFSR